MEELLRQGHGYLHGMWRFRWWRLDFAWIVGIVGCAVVYIMPDKYESSARGDVDTPSLLLRVVREQGVAPNVGQQALILGKTLISPPNMEKLIDAMARLLEQVVRRYPDRIVFDSPPLLVTTASRVLATHMGQLVIVATTHDTMKHELATIEFYPVKLLVLNKSREEGRDSYGNGYKYGYGYGKGCRSRGGSGTKRSGEDVH
ncbi:MAG: hypothetical protein LBP86_11435 [Azoarcus sp.]|jgi:hypothetical protein|nr:hypothetical protein [Azoarcus sp.]